MKALPEGERFGNYELTGLIGVGGMGAVYRAVHPEIGRVVAIKVLRAELARDDAAVGRFFDEARAVNSIRHEGIVDIYDLGRRDDGQVYYVMEYLAGEDLAHQLKRDGRMRPVRAVALLRQVCDALGAAHRRGIIHRDLKPQNLFVTERAGEPRLKILDFGIAKLMHEVPGRPETSTGVVLGTVHYMSPEQAQSEPIDARTDLYSLGCILYQLVTGSVPYPGNNVMQVLSQLVTRPLVPPSQRAPELGLPPEFDQVVLRALAKSRNDRFSDTEELAAALSALDLSHVIDPPQRPRRPSGPALSPVGVAEGGRADISGEGDTVEQRMDGAALDSTVDVTPRPAAEPGAPFPPTRGPHAPQRPLDASGSGPTRPTANPTTPPLTASGSTGKTAPATPSTIDPPSLSDSANLLRDEEPRLLDFDSERRIVRVVVIAEAFLFVLGLALYWLPAGATSVDRAVLGRWLPPFFATTLAMLTLTVLFVRTQDNPRGRWVVNRALTLLAVALITTATGLTGALGSYDILYYPLLIILDRVREGRSLAQLTLASSLVAFTALAIGSHFGWLPYAPLYPNSFDPALVHDRGLVGLVVTVVAGTSYLSYLLVDHLAARVLRREQELRQLGRGLAGRLQEQTELVRRGDDLRRFVEPALADAILRGEAGAALGHQRRRITVVRVDCQAIARAAEEIDPEELAVLLNDFYARVADLAVSSGGTVDRFAGGEISVLFGALRSDGAATDAAHAMQFALEALPAVADLARRCEVAGIEERPRGRAAVHTGFATVGSFGSPSRLEFTAVGPLVEATSAVLAAAEPDTVATTHASVVLLQERLTVKPLGERPLPGARHAVRLYRLEKLS
jgi:serine/threonine-protein kinase